MPETVLEKRPLCEISKDASDKAHQALLTSEPEGVYVWIWLKKNSEFPEYDYLQDNSSIAKTQCHEEFGIPLDSWSEISALDAKKMLAPR